MGCPAAPLGGDSVVTKKDIVKAISEQIGMTQLKTKEIVQQTFDAIIDTLVREHRIELRNFGVFEVKKRAARKARNPRTGERVDVAEKYVVTFKPGKEMEERVRLLEQQEAEKRPQRLPPLRMLLVHRPRLNRFLRRLLHLSSLLISTIYLSQTNQTRPDQLRLHLLTANRRQHLACKLVFSCEGFAAAGRRRLTEEFPCERSSFRPFWQCSVPYKSAALSRFTRHLPISGPDS